ncbi:MAG TPA: hypothetical protein VK919_05125 [Solirubrobacterales bacterium]|nr:hypothetical protein [Solirubrobacterales bacterium]
MASLDSLSIRIAADADRPRLRRLAELDAAPPLRSPSLLAEVGGEAVAALSLEDGRSVADPWRRTAFVVELLGVRARQLREASFPPRPHRGATSGTRSPASQPFAEARRESTPGEPFVLRSRGSFAGARLRLPTTR